MAVMMRDQLQKASAVLAVMDYTQMNSKAVSYTHLARRRHARPAGQTIEQQGGQERKKKSVCRYKPAFGNAGNTDALSLIHICNGSILAGTKMAGS